MKALSMQLFKDSARVLRKEAASVRSNFRDKITTTKAELCSIFRQQKALEMAETDRPKRALRSNQAGRPKEQTPVARRGGGIL